VQTGGVQDPSSDSVLSRVTT